MNNYKSVRTQTIAGLRAEIAERIKQASSVKDPDEVGSIPSSNMVETTCTPYGESKKSEDPKGTFDVTEVTEKGEVSPKKGENIEEKVVAKGASLLDKLNQKKVASKENVAANISIEPDILRKVGMAILNTEEGAKMAEKVLRKEASAEYAAAAIKQASVEAEMYEREIMKKQAGLSKILNKVISAPSKGIGKIRSKIRNKLINDDVARRIEEAKSQGVTEQDWLGTQKEVAAILSGMKQDSSSKLLRFLKKLEDSPKTTAAIAYGVPTAAAGVYGASKLASVAEQAGAADAQAMAANPELANPQADPAGDAAAAQGISPEIIMQAIDELVQAGQIAPEVAQQLTQLFASGGNVPLDMETLATQLEQAIQQGLISEDQAMALAQSIAGAPAAAPMPPAGPEAQAGAPVPPPPAAPTEQDAAMGEAKTASEALKYVAQITQNIKTASVVAGEIAPEDEEATVADVVEVVNGLVEAGEIAPEEGQELLEELAGAVAAEEDIDPEEAMVEEVAGEEEIDPEEALADVTPEDVVESLVELVEAGEITPEEALKITTQLDAMLEGEGLDEGAVEELKELADEEGSEGDELAVAKEDAPEGVKDVELEEGDQKPAEEETSEPSEEELDAVIAKAASARKRQ